jgi:uncharacterized protein YeaO (DUF488 family)
MTCMVHSARISHHCADGLDITRATAQAHADRGEAAPGETLAPSWGLLRRYKDRLRVAARQGDVEEMDALWAAYARGYHAEQDQRDAAAPRRLDAILARTSVTLQCVCADPARCHRSLARQRLRRAGARDMGERAPAQRRLPL